MSSGRPRPQSLPLADVNSSSSTSRYDKLQSSSSPTSPLAREIQKVDYFGEGNELQVMPARIDEARISKAWVPLVLRPIFWVPYVSIMFIGAIGLEVALYLNKQSDGWPLVGSDFTAEIGVMHYVYTFLPTLFFSLVVAVWATTDVEIKRLQPYVDLVRGNAPPETSILLDYTRDNFYLVWLNAWKNKHHIVALSAAVHILLAGLSPLGSSLFAVKYTFWGPPPATVANLQLISLNPALSPSAVNSARDLLSGAVVAAAGYAGAQVGFNGVPNPPFTLNGYTVGEFEPFMYIDTTNATMIVNTTAVYTDPGCVPGTVNTTQLASGSWTNSASYSGCTFTWVANQSSPYLYGHGILDGSSGCDFNVNSGTPFAPVAFWFFTYQPQPMSSVVFCNSTMELWDVQVQYDVNNQNLTSVEPIAPMTNMSNFSSLAANVSALGGRTYNGWALPSVATTDNDNDGDNDTTDLTVSNNIAAAQVQLAAAIFNAATSSPAGLTATFQNDGFVTMTNQVCTTFLVLIARSFYFIDQPENMVVEVNALVLRLFLSPFAVHILAVALIILAISGTYVNIKHTLERRDLLLTHVPGSIASAVALGSRTRVGDILADPHQLADSAGMEARLHELRFTMNPVTLKIVMEGEPEYDVLKSERETREMEVDRRMGKGEGRGMSMLGVLKTVLSPTSSRDFQATAQEHAELKSPEAFSPTLPFSGPSTSPSTPLPPF